MRALVLHDIINTAATEYRLLEAVLSALENSGWEGEIRPLKYGDIKPCLGCFSCWVTTPGLCIFGEDCPNAVSKTLVQADAVILVSEIVYGSFSPAIKAYLDRAIPNVLPFFETYHGEMHHKKRYRKLPAWLTVGYGKTTDAEEGIFQRLTERNALNLQVEDFHCMVVQETIDMGLVKEEITNTLEAIAG